MLKTGIMRKTTCCRIFFLSIFTGFLSVGTFNQATAQWCVDINNDTTEQLNDILINNDGSKIFVGYTGPNGVVKKTDPAGLILQWQIYLPNCYNVETVVAADDTSYLCVGRSSSATNTTGNHWGAIDVVLTRINQDGIVLWQKFYGGSKTEEAIDAVRTSDGGFAVLSTTYSTDGQLSGAAPLSQYETNAWVFKIDPAGNLLWQKSLDYLDSTFSDKGVRILTTNDQQLFVLTQYYNVAYLIDQASGAVSYFNYSANGNPGNVHTSQTINAVCKTYSGDAYLFLYTSYSSTPFPTYFSCVKKISADGIYISTDTIRNSLDMQCEFGVRAIIPTPDGSFILGGAIFNPFAGSPIPTTDPYVYNHATKQQYSLYGQQYYDDMVCSIKLLPGADAVIAGYNYEGECTEGNGYVPRGWYSMKFTLDNVIRGNVYIDLNNNNTQDGGETTLKNVKIASTSSNTQVVTQPFSPNGDYRIPVPSGTYRTKPLLPRPYYTSTPDSVSTTFNSSGQLATANFALHPIAGIKDYAVNVISSNRVRPGFEQQYYIACTNNGTDTLNNRILLFIKDSRFSFMSAVPSPSSVSGDSIVWNISSVLPAASASFSLTLTAGTIPQVNIGDTLRSSVYLDSTGDVSGADNLIQISELVSGSYDPNDKQENYAGSMPIKDIVDGKNLDYLIRFQNTGNDTAFTIVVRDTLDAKLDASGFTMLNASHAYQLSIKDGKYITWTFRDIKLLDSFHNEPASHGYISYRIKPKLPIGIDDVISNRAAIYFDFNPAVLTNNQLTKVGGPAVPSVWTGVVSVAWENPANWNTNKVPDINSAVIIPAAAPNYPEINSNANCYSIKVDPAATVLIKTGFKLNVNGKSN